MQLLVSLTCCIPLQDSLLSYLPLSDPLSLITDLIMPIISGNLVRTWQRHGLLKLICSYQVVFSRNALANTDALHEALRTVNVCA
jgi:hypothetical protein